MINHENVSTVNTLVDLHKGVKVQAQGMFTEFTRLLSEMLSQAASDQQELAQDDQQGLTGTKSLCAAAKVI